MFMVCEHKYFVSHFMCTLYTLLITCLYSINKQKKKKNLSCIYFYFPYKIIKILNIKKLNT